MSSEAGNVKINLETDKVNTAPQGSRLITSPRIRASSFIAKSEIQKQVQAKQSHKVTELTNQDNELCVAISFAKHNSKSVKEIVTKISELSSKMFQQLSVNDLIDMNDTQREKLDLFIDWKKKSPDPSVYTAYIEHLEKAIVTNWKIFEDELDKNRPSIIGSKAEIFEGFHFWHEVLEGLSQQGDDFSASVVINMIASRYMGFEMLKETNKDIAEYQKKYPNDAALFASEYKKRKEKIENCNNQQLLIEACVNAEPGIPSSRILYQLMKFNKANQNPNKNEILQYQLLALQGKFFDYLIQKQDVKIQVTKNESNLLEMREIQDGALKNVDERLKKCDELISTSNHTELIHRYNEKIILLNLKEMLIAKQMVNLTSMKTLHMTTKESLINLPTVKEIYTNQKLMIENRKAIMADISKVQDELKIIKDVSKFVNKIEEFRMLPYKNKTLSEGDIENHFNALKKELLNFQEIVNKDEFKKNNPVLSESVDRATHELLNLLQKHLEHARIQVLSRPGAVQHEIDRLKNDYQLHMTNMRDETSIPEAIKGLQAVRNRVEKLLEITNNPNFLLKAEVKNLQAELNSFKASMPQKQERQIEQSIPQEVTAQNRLGSSPS